MAKKKSAGTLGNRTDEQAGLPGTKASSPGVTVAGTAVGTTKYEVVGTKPQSRPKRYELSKSGARIINPDQNP